MSMHLMQRTQRTVALADLIFDQRFEADLA